MSQSAPSVAVLDSGVGSNKVEKTQAIMDHIRSYNKYTLGDFFETLFSSSSELNGVAQQALTQWLSGRTRVGTRPAEIIDAIYRHSHSLKHDNYHPRTSQYKNLCLPTMSNKARSDRSISFLPPPEPEEINRTCYNSREGLEEWAARAVLHQVNHEAGLLERRLQKSANPTWAKLESFSIARERSIMQSEAPLMWQILSVIGSACRKSARSSGTANDSGTDSGEDSDSDVEGHVWAGRSGRTPRTSAQKATDTATTTAVYILIGSRNQLVGFFRTFLGASLFACSAPKAVYRIGSRLHLSPSHSTELSYLRSLAGSAKEELRQIGRGAFGATRENPGDVVASGKNPTAFMLLFDNIQRYVIPRHETVGNKTRMKTGTAATLVVLEDVPAGAFARDAYTAKLLLAERQNLTLDELYAAVDYGHLERVGTATIMRTLVNNVKELGHFKKGVEDLFKDSNYCAKNPLATRKSCIYPVATSGINEGTASGASEVLDDLIGQLDIPPKQFDDILCLVGGNQVSIDGMRQARRSLEQEATIYAQKDWVLPLIQGWHMGWAYLKAIIKTHYYDVPGKQTLGLRRSLGALGVNLSTENCNFYPWLNALSTVFDSLVLSAVRQGQECTLESLQALANQIYKEYLTTESYQLALSPPTDSQPSLADLESILGENMEKLRLDATEGIDLSRSLAEHRQNLPDTLTMPRSGLQGDHVLAHNKLLMRDLFIMTEFDAGMSEGDPGRMLEIMNVFLFAFWGTNSTKYGNELLEMTCNFKYEYPPEMRQAIINNMLVNPSGLPKHWQAGDLLQEHHNLKIKTIYNTKSSDFDDPFLRESVSLNVAGLSRVEESLMEQLGLARTDKHRALAKRRSDINVLGAHFEKEKVLEFTRSRSQPYEATDMIGAGYNRLAHGALQNFLSRTLADPAEVAEQDDA